MELVRGGDHQVAHLNDGLHPGLASRALGHHQHPDGLDGTIHCFAYSERSSADDGPGCFDGIEGVGLPVVASGLAVGAVDLDHLDATATQESGQSDAIRASALDADLVNLAEVLEPGQQRLVAGGISIERLGADQPAQRIESRSE